MYTLQRHSPTVRPKAEKKNINFIMEEMALIR